MADRGAPTGKWPTLPPQLQGTGQPRDISHAEVKLVVRRPGVPEVEIPIEKNEFTIGRDASEVDLALDDEEVSRRHAQLTMDDRGYFKLVDLGSRNAIRFADRPVRRLNLVDGDEFSIGKAHFVFRAKMTRLPTAETPVHKATTPQDSVMIDVHIPDPEPLAEVGSDESVIGWRPEAAPPPAMSPLAGDGSLEAPRRRDEEETDQEAEE